MTKLPLLCVLLVACSSTVETPENPTPNSGKASHGSCAKRCDLSTDEKLGDLYKELTGKSLGPKPECVSRSDVLPRVVALGSFASDRGCALQGVFVDCCYSEPRAPAALLDLGWSTFDANARAALAAQFAREVVLAFEPPLSEATDDFNIELAGKMTPAFSPLAAKTNADGGVSVEYWRSVPGGMVRQLAPTYQRWRLTFSDSGATSSHEKLDEFQGKPFETQTPLPLDPRPGH